MQARPTGNAYENIATENHEPADVWAFLKDGDHQSVQGGVSQRLGAQVGRQLAQAKDNDYKAALF